MSFNLLAFWDGCEGTEEWLQTRPVPSEADDDGILGLPVRSQGSQAGRESRKNTGRQHLFRATLRYLIKRMQQEVQA